MKKLLLATTMLAGTAGFAAAEVTWSGSASMGVARDGEVSGTAFTDDGIHVYSSGTLDIAASTETDGGLTISLSTSVSFGTSYSFADDDGFAAEDGTIGEPTLAISGAFGTLTFSNDNIDQLYSDDESGDVSYTYSVGDLSLGLVYDVDNTNAYDWSASASYKVSGVTLAAVVDAEDSYNLSAAYEINGLTATVETDSDAGADAVNTLTLGYAVDAFSGEISADDAEGWSIAVGYEANGIGVDLSTDEANAWEATASYDLGGNASLEAGVNYVHDGYAGVTFSF